MAEAAKPLRVMVLCGRSPRHLYVANALCRAAEVVAVVQETGSEFSWKKLAKTLRRRIEEELQYPSTIKITVIREQRFTETAT